VWVRNDRLDPFGEIVDGNVNRFDGFFQVDLELEFVGEFLENVFAFKNDVYDRRREFQAAAACQIEQVLEFMGKAVHRLKPQETRGAFESVEGAENRAQRGGVVGFFLQHQNALFDVLEVLSGLVCKLAKYVSIALKVDRGEFLPFLLGGCGCGGSLLFAGRELLSQCGFHGLRRLEFGRRVVPHIGKLRRKSG